MMVVESLWNLFQEETGLNLPSPTGGAMVGTMRQMKRDIAIMATVVVAMVVMGNHEMGSGDNNPKEKRGKLRCYFCKGPHIKRDCPKVSSVSAIKRNDEPKEAKPIEKKTSMVNSMVLILKKRNDGEGLMFVDINIAS
ncbi:hypothetical protein Gotri_018461 [Gossypium trilobum]|uniref:CCHC-type domain-containing protein n=1 Tax=Gossypium trilobum TaxID=34281 RepID=A0A7J9E9Q6_9ROSI|nr:hypothetical protein [Gossypium trilobum]